MNQYLSAQEAADLLGVKAQTLYAYVSRGLIRSEADVGRQRRYVREDVERLRQQREPGMVAQAAAEGALRWGMPVLDSALTLISAGKLAYRGYDVQELALTQSIEAVAGLLWFADEVQRAQVALNFSARVPTAELPTSLPLLQRLQLVLAQQTDLAAFDLRLPATAQTGARIVGLLAAVIAQQPVANGIAATLARAWQIDAELVNLALVVSADHELNASAFAARVVASTNATLYAAVSAGLAAMSGPRHGANIDRTAALLHTVTTPAIADQALAAWLRRGEHLSGFGHRLYPNGDPRAALLLTAVRQRHNTACADALIAAGSAVTGTAPNIDLALAVFEQAADLPPESGLALFVLGRTIGWVAHCIEQYALDELIRPRARYVGNVKDE